MNGTDSESKAKHLDEMIHRIANMIGRIEKTPRNYGTTSPLHHSEIHTIRDIGREPGINVTGLAQKQGVTKGAVSQVLAKLEKKKLIIKMKEIDNDKTVYLKLSEQGVKAFQGHRQFHANMHAPLVDVVASATPEQAEFVEKFLSVVEKFCEETLNNRL